MIGSIRLLNLRYLRRQPLRSALAALAVTAGVSLVVAVVVMSESLTTSLATVGRQLAGPAPLRIVGADSHGGLEPSVLGAVRATPGVGSAVPAVQAVTVAESGTGQKAMLLALGVDCGEGAHGGALDCPRLASGSKTVASTSPNVSPGSRPPLAARPTQQAAVTSTLAVSSSMQRQLGPAGVLRTDIGPVPLAGAVAVPSLDAVNQGHVALLPLAEAQRLFDRAGRLDTIYVQPAPGVGLSSLRHRLAQAVGPWNGVLSASDPPPGATFAGFIVPLLGLIGLLALVVSALMVANTMALSLAERGKELALAGALGATPRLIMTATLSEAGVLGAIGGMAGVGLGWVLAHPLAAELSRQTQLYSGSAVNVSFPPAILGLGVLLGAGTAAVAAWRPARRASAGELTAELTGRQRWVHRAPGRGVLVAVSLTLAALAGLVLTYLSQRHGALAPWQPLAARIGLVVAAVFSYAAIGAWAPHALRAAARLAQTRSERIGLALSNLVREPRRIFGIAVAAGTAVGLGCALAILLPALQDTVGRSLGASVGNRVFVDNLNINNSFAIDAKLSPATLAALSRLPGVEGIDEDHFLLTGHGSDVVAVASYGNDTAGFHVIEGQGVQSAFARQEVMIGPNLARARHLRAGSSIRLDAPGGVVSLKVGGIWEDPDELGTAVTAPSSLLRSIWGPQPPTEAFLRPAPGVSSAQVASEARGIRADPDLTVLSAEQYVNVLAREVNQQVGPFWALQRALLAVALLATGSTLLLVGVQRRRELGLLSAVGLGPRGMAGMTLAEAGVLGAVASGLGVLAGLVQLGSLREVSGILFGLAPPFRLVWLPRPALLYSLVATAAVLVGGAWPAWRMSRIRVVDALRHD